MATSCDTCFINPIMPTWLTKLFTAGIGHKMLSFCRYILRQVRKSVRGNWIMWNTTCKKLPLIYLIIICFTNWIFWCITVMWSWTQVYRKNSRWPKYWFMSHISVKFFWKQWNFCFFWKVLLKKLNTFDSEITITKNCWAECYTITIR